MKKFKVAAFLAALTFGLFSCTQTKEEATQKAWVAAQQYTATVYYGDTLIREVPAGTKPGTILWLKKYNNLKVQVLKLID